MPNFHPKFPFGKGLWIWELSSLYPKFGTVQAIAQKCKDVGIAWVALKSGDGTHTWETQGGVAQFNTDIINIFHQYGLKIYSWSYVYGDDPKREADISVWSLEKGVDGHIFDAEGQYEGKPEAAVIMLESVRGRQPDAFLAHAPFPIIDSHQTFPYLEFGKYCDAVMPQVYYGEFKKKPAESVIWMYDNFMRWENIWKAAGHEDSIKPLSPIGQAYDDPGIGYTCSPEDILDFIDATKGYMSCSFWSFQHVVSSKLSDQLWGALKSGELNPAPILTQPNTTTTPETSQNPAQTPSGGQNGTPGSSLPTTETPATPTTTPAEPTSPVVTPPASIPASGTSTPETTPATPQAPLTHLDIFLAFIRLVWKTLESMRKGSDKT
jgi:hypothetical protein